MSLRVIELPEGKTQSFAKEELAESVVKALHDAYANQVSVEPPSFLNGNQWRLTSRGWVGYIPLDGGVHFSLSPKVSIQNLFGMIEYAYKLNGFRVLEGLVDAESIAEIYDRLALILAKRVLGRLRRGLYRSYMGQDDNLPYVRGRMDLLAHVRDPARVTLPCCFEEHTADLEDNQILLWTLTRVLECGVCTELSLPYVRQARRAMQSFSSMTPFSGESCVDRLYNRLNDDYSPMHALCRFFLEHTGPTHRAGDRRMLPILVDMDRLFELFVFEWMKAHLPAGLSIQPQVTVAFEMGQQVTVRIDITISENATGRTCHVLDTKYKAPDQPAAADIEAVVAYAVAKDCNEAVLIYPGILPHPIDGHFGTDIRVRSVVFDLEGDLEAAGLCMLNALIPLCGT
jgi:5-methylcytosine-specific restriction enzyme subunit McrC